jgi:chromosome segregation protein
LLKLKKLQILGFKSFCDRSELRFHGEGVAAIVGPNGCGKSNIADAICWVLGEQSAKSLRGSRMEDVIFAGTPARKPTGMAEVSLTLIDPEVYDGPIGKEPEIEISDELPQQDWDEEVLRRASDEETAQYLEEVQPGKAEEVESNGAPVAGAASVIPPNGPDALCPPSDVEGLVAGTEADSVAQDDVSNSTPPLQQAETANAGDPAQPQVVLKIRRRRFKPATLKKGEITVTRRLFRSGDSEYLLNHKLCRLRDIQDLFMGTGLGPESYAIIEQGRIGQILSSRPTDRRAIIEEAAGITKFKSKKRLSEARLEDARLNLNRVNDIFEEVTRQMNSLKRQASKAARYVRVRDEMRAKLRVVLASKLGQLEAESSGHQSELHAIGEEMRTRSEAVQQMEAEQGSQTQRGYALADSLRENRERLAETARESDRAVTRQKQNEERCRELDERTVTAEQELSQTSVRLETLHAERDANRQALDNAEAEVGAAQQELSARQQDAASAASALASLEKLQEMRRVSILEAANAAATVRNRMTQAEEHMAALERESQRLTAEIDASNLQLESFGGERGQLALEFDSTSRHLEAITARIGEGRAELERTRAAENDSKRRLDGLRAEYASLLGKKSSLEAVITEHGYSTESVRRLFQSGALQNGFAPVGVLADFLEVEDQYEHVVEDFLREELNYVVVKSWDAADRGLQLLRTDVDGRATFLVHPHDAQARFPFVVDEAHQAVRQTNDGLVPLKNCIRVLNGFGNSLEVILPKLRDGYIVPTADSGRELALDNPEAFFLAQSGECFHNVTVTGGRPPAAGPLSLKRELREVLRNLADLENTLREEEGRAQKLARSVTDLIGLLQRLEDERRESEKQAMTSGHTLRQLDGEMARVRERLSVYEREFQRAVNERAAKTGYIAEQQAELEQRDRMRAELEQVIAAAQQELGDLRTARDAAAQNASEARAQVATLEERRRAALQAAQRFEILVNEVAGRVDSLRAQIASAAAEKEQRVAENVQLSERLIAVAAERQACEDHERELQVESEQVRARLAEIENELRGARETLDRIRDRRGEVAAILAKLESDAAHLSETCLNELGVGGSELRADPALVLVEGEQLAAEDAVCRELRSRLDNMGPVNMMALEEYNEVAQRHQFLETQRQDLLESISNTQQTIREIETVTRQKFTEAFGIINQNFQSTFRKLFNGGQAFMKLTDEQNSEESGIDIVASPPGKRLQNVLLLSGGEKALTALALLMSIFQYQPSPFCILDEVDAPLDDSNIARFTELVRDMSSRTQFVLITHSKKTMSIAPVMYGVTMQEPGVSKLVAVRFDESPSESSQAAD